VMSRTVEDFIAPSLGLGTAVGMVRKQLEECGSQMRRPCLLANQFSKAVSILPAKRPHRNDRPK